MSDSRTSIPNATATATHMAAITGLRIPIAPTGMKMKMRRQSRMAKTLTAAMLAATLLATASAGNAQPEPAGQAPIEVPPAPPLVIGSGDLIDVSMFDAPELSGRFRVDHKGDVDMPLLNTIHVAGLRADQAAKLIEDQYVKAQILVPEGSRATVFIE